MDTLTSLHFLAYGMMLLCGMTAAGIGMILIWQGGSERVNQLLFLWGGVVAAQQVVQLFNALSATIPIYTPTTSILMARIWLTLNHSAYALLFLSILIHTRFGSRRRRIWTQVVVTIWYLYLFYENHFNYRAEPLFNQPVAFFSFNGYPIFDLAAIAHPFKPIIAISGTLLFVLLLPIMAHHTKIAKRVRQATFIFTLSFVLGFITVFQQTTVSVITFVLGYAILAHSILDSDLFDPLRQANIKLIKSKRELEKAYVWVEHQIYERTLQLEMAVAREHVLAQELERALADAVRINEMRSKIIETVSHEFRTPLTKINTSAELLIKYNDRLTPEKQHQLQQKIHNAITYLTNLIDNIMLIDSSSQSVADIQSASIPIRSLCESLERRLKHTFARRNNLIITYQSNDTRCVSVDSNLLGQLLLQLIDNAQKFSAPNAPIYVLISLVEKTLQLSVSDVGIGISAEDLPHIWELFYRGKNIGTRRGLGVGLFAVQRIVRDMGGDISAESGPNNTTFTVTLNVPTTEGHF